MIAFIKGKIVFKNENHIIIENQSIGFKVFVSHKTAEQVFINKEVCLFTFLFTANDKMELYGFLSLEELNLFEKLEKLSGIGPKAALKITSLGTIDDLKKAVENNDQDYFSQIKGIGQKKIQKIILEIGGSFKKFLLKQESSGSEKEVIKGLRALGFSLKEAETALNQVPKNIKDPAQRMQKALQFFGQKND